LNNVLLSQAKDREMLFVVNLNLKSSFVENTYCYLCVASGISCWHAVGCNFRTVFIKWQPHSW